MVRIGPERHGIGGTMWDYSGSFAVVTKKEGHTVPMSLPSKLWAYNHCPCRNELPEQRQLLSWSASKELVPGNRNGAGS